MELFPDLTVSPKMEKLPDTEIGKSNRSSSRQRCKIRSLHQGGAEGLEN